MINSNAKKAYVLLSTIFIIFFIILSIGSYVKYSTTVTSKEFHKDLAKIRGYWACYGAKELESDMTYKYYRLDSNISLYDIDVTRNPASWLCLFYCTDNYTWNITNASNSGIKNETIFRRILKVNRYDYNQTYYYEH